MTAKPNLREFGLKVTGPRVKILELFSSSPIRHWTAETVYKHLLQENIDVGLATVYRVLTQFEQAGLLKRHHFETDRATYEYNEGEHHDHLVCMQCGKVEEFCDPEIERRQAEIAAERGYTIREHALYLYVECNKADCPNKQAAKE